jgi:2-C-methyl-D-erythritol 2,4-cyclodiphosphate synthase
MRLRIGQGFDVHAFTEGDHLVIGGVTIPFTQGILAHSDGDLLLHAITDALLGALALGDIGQHFPDTDARWAGVDSRVLLRETVALVASRGYRLINLDATLIGERPRFASLIPAMRTLIASDFGVDVDQVSIKATTTEKLGFCGRGEGLAAMATLLLGSED